MNENGLEESMDLGRKCNMPHKVKSEDVNNIFDLLLYHLKRAGQSFTICEGDIWDGLPLNIVYVTYAKFSLGVIEGTEMNS